MIRQKVVKEGIVQVSRKKLFQAEATANKESWGGCLVPTRSPKEDSVAGPGREPGES